MANARDHRKEITEKFVAMLERGEAPPWRKPWDTGAMQVPKNAVSGRAYRGANAYFLMMAGMGKSDNRWITSAQLHHLAEEQLKKAGFDPVYDKNVPNPAYNKAKPGKELKFLHKGEGWLDKRTEPATKIADEHLPRMAKGATYQPIEFWKYFDDKSVDRDDGTKETVLSKRDRPVAQLFYVYNLGDVENLTLERFTQKQTGHEHAPLEAAERVIAATGAVIKHHPVDQAYSQ